MAHDTTGEISFFITRRFKNPCIVRITQENYTHSAGTNTCTKSQAYGWSIVPGVWFFEVPKLISKAIVITVHDLNGYFDVERTIARIMQDYCFPAI